MIILYTLIFYLLLPIITLRLLWRSRHSPLYRQRFLERFGFYKDKNKLSNTIWIHAVSLGEAKLAIQLVKTLQTKIPNQQFVVTTMTLTGSQQITTELSEKVIHVYVPYDFPGAIKRFFAQFQPKILILLETELWPNMLQQTAKHHIPVVLANARLSSHSAKGYQKIKFFIKKILSSLTLVLAQTKKDAERFAAIGVPEKNIQVAGNLKYDIKISDELLSKAKSWREKNVQARPIFIAASTHGGEEEIILTAITPIKKIIPNLLLILVPRHPERFEQVINLCEQYQYKTLRRSENKIINDADIFVLDTIGELMQFYAVADVAFVGGSLINKGGHNLLEPAVFSLPVISGPFLENFAAIAEEMKNYNALTLVNNAAGLSQAVIELLQDKNLREQKGHAAKEVTLNSQNALDKTCETVLSYL